MRDRTLGHCALLITLVVVATYIPSAAAAHRSNSNSARQHAAISTITLGPSALDLATSMANDPALVTGATWVSQPPVGTPDAVADSPLGGFPTSGSSFGIMTSGDASLAGNPSEDFASGVDLGPPIRGDSERDVSILQVDLSVPAKDDCLAFDFKFASEEYPQFVGSAYNDAFIAELDTSDWTTSGSAISAPHDFAFDPNGNVISINGSGFAALTPEEAAGTVYGGATTTLQAAVPATPGAHSLYLSIFDQGDYGLDSAVFLDNLRAAKTKNGNCQTGDVTVPSKDFRWQMQPRFGQRPDGTHLIPYFNSRDKINPHAWTVHFVIPDCQSDSAVTYAWDFGDGDTAITPNCEISHAYPENHRRYGASLRVIAGSGESDRTKQWVRVNDDLVVSIGDSFASGEGNPDVPGVCGLFGCHPQPRWQNRDCHRSAWAGPSRAAIHLENHFRHSAVTFVHLACSGATTMNGLLRGYKGAEWDGHRVISQVRSIRRLVTRNGRKIDALLISIGGNDVGFDQIVQQCVLFRDCGRGVLPFSIHKRFLARLSLFRARLNQLNRCLTSHQLGACPKGRHGLGIAPQRIHITQYPDVGEYLGAHGRYRYCHSYAGISHSEFRWAINKIYKVLNRHTKRAAHRLGWHFIGGIKRATRGHGICQSSSKSWFRKLNESVRIQGLTNGVPMGWFHPDHKGQRRAYAVAIYKRLVSELDPEPARG
jgi:PKD domain/GDSL-like Lipase/Acylhydrolase